MAARSIGATVANEQRQIAEQQRQRAEDTLAAATKTANSLVFDLAQRFRHAVGVPAVSSKTFSIEARALQEQLIKSGQVTPELKRSQAAALVETANSFLAIGDTAGALAAAEQARKIFTDLLAGNPANTASGSAICPRRTNKIGDVRVAQGDLAGALESYRDSLDIADRLAKSDPGNTGWQRDLSVSLDKVGDVQVAQGDLAGALKSFRDSFAIGEQAGEIRARQRRLAE